MKPDYSSQNANPSGVSYFKIMSEIPFMQNFMEDPDIFNPDSPKCRNFLIQSFCYLHPDFHYLSFLNQEDVDLEIMKVAGILQIFSTNFSKQNVRLFHNMSKDDIHKFWLKFFTLFKKKNDFNTDSLLNVNLENKINFFKDMKSTLNYLNYQFSVVNVSRIQNVDVSKELNNWKEEGICSTVIPDESTCLNDMDTEEQIIDIDVEKLVIDIKQVTSMYENKETANHQCTLEHTDFFINFIKLSHNFLEYKKNLNIIDSNFLNEINSKMVSRNEGLTTIVYFMKRCNNLVNTLKDKVRALHYGSLNF